MLYSSFHSIGYYKTVSNAISWACSRRVLMVAVSYWFLLFGFTDRRTAAAMVLTPSAVSVVGSSPPHSDRFVFTSTLQEWRAIDFHSHQTAPKAELVHPIYYALYALEAIYRAFRYTKLEVGAFYIFSHRFLILLYLHLSSYSTCILLWLSNRIGLLLSFELT